MSDLQEFRPPLERALKAGKTALVNVVGDRTIGHPSLGGNLLGSTRAIPTGSDEQKTG